MSAPIHLTDEQVNAIFAASYPLRPNQRSQFLAACAQELARLPMLGDGSVHRVVMAVQKQFFDPPQFVSGDGGARSRRRIVDDEDDRPRKRPQPRTLGAL